MEGAYMIWGQVLQYYIYEWVSSIEKLAHYLIAWRMAHDVEHKHQSC